uniref:J domain-containing protein n=1 Tax=Cucumis sativus TaxID=3659 RepID=A0A0A0KLG9_CUCSA
MKLELFTSVDGMCRRRALSLVSVLQNRGKSSSYRLVLCYSSSGIRLFTCGSDSDSARSEFSGENAYEILEVSQTSSSDEIKASFRKLAKETHPDLAESRKDSSASLRFVQILAAYEVLMFNTLLL